MIANGLKISLVTTLLFSSALVSQPAYAWDTASTLSVISVNTTSDELNTDADCSLREAIRAANLDASVSGCPAGIGADTIVLGVGNFNLSITGSNEDHAATGDLDIIGDLTILGSGVSKTIIDGKNLDRVFHIVGSGNVTISNLTIQNGFSSTTGLFGGGGILNENGDLILENVTVRNNRSVKTGGGIDNASVIRLTNVTLSGNTAQDGGGIFSDRTLVLDRVTLNGNSATATGGGLDNSGDATLINVTISGNNANLSGGGLFNDGNVTLLNVTFSGNSTAIANANLVRFKNTLVANSTADNCTGTGSFTSEGNNLDSGNTCHFTAGTDITGQNPKLNALEDNKGPTLTHALAADSPAIDSGDNFDCPQFDQRGGLRPADGNNDGDATCDIGAFEYGAYFPIIYLPFVIRKP